MFKETKKFFGPQKYQNVSSGLSLPDGLTTAINADQNFAVSFGVVGDVMLRDGEQIPLFLNPLDIAADAANAKSIPEVVSIASASLVSNQQLNRCEQPLPFEPALFTSSFRRATANSTTVQQAIQACVSELNKIYIPIIGDSNRKIFEIDGIAARNFPLAEYKYQDQLNLSMARGVVYGASILDESLNPITSPLMAMYAVTYTGDDLAIISDNTMRFFTRGYEKPPLRVSPPLMALPLSGGTYQSIVQGTDSFPLRIYTCNITTKKIVGLSTTPATYGDILSNLAIDTKNTDFPIIGLSNFTPQVFDILPSDGVTFVIAEQGKFFIVQMPQGFGNGGALTGWTVFPHAVVGICRTNVATGVGLANNDMSVLYENPVAFGPNLASRVAFNYSISASAGGVWTKTVTLPSGPTTNTFSPTISGFATAASNPASFFGPAGTVETKTAILFPTSNSDLNDSRVAVLRVRLCGTSPGASIPFSRDEDTGALLSATVNIHSFTTATPGVVVDGDLATGIGPLLGSFLIPYTNATNTGLLHPPPDPDGTIRGVWVFDLPLANLDKTGYTGIYVELTGYTFPIHSTIGGGVNPLMKLILAVSSDISSTTPTSFGGVFPPEGTSRYEERIFNGYILDKQQEFEVPVKNVKQFCTLDQSRNSLGTKPKVRTYAVEFPRFAYVNNSVAKTNNGSTYIANSYSSPKLTSGYSAKVGEFYDSISGSILTTKTKRLILTFDRLHYWFHSMRLIDGACKLQLHIRSYTSRLIDNSGNIRVISNPNAFSLLSFIVSTDPESGIKVINGGTVFKSIPRNMSLDTDGDGIVTEGDLGRDYIVEFDVTSFMVTLRASNTQINSAGFIFRNQNESQFFNLANGNKTIVGGEISSTVEVFDELAPRLIFTDNTGYMFKKNGYKSASMPPLVAKVFV